MNPIGTQARPLRVAIVGSGPSGCYVLKALGKHADLSYRADVFDRLPTPFGLVRAGVAPDHQNIKKVARSYHRFFRREEVRFFGNVMLGRDISVDDLLQAYDAVVYAVGCESARALGVPGEELEGVHSATEFVFWYNGHPDHRACRFGLSRARRIAVVGNGNVAIDVARVLARRRDELAQTDIADYALEALRGAPLEEVVLLGRRGAGQAAFSPKELEELAHLDGISFRVRPEEAVSDPLTEAWLASGDAPKTAARNLALLQEQAEAEPDEGVRVTARFLVSPTAFLGDERLEAVRLERNRLVDANGTPRPRPTGEEEEQAFDLVFKAVGYRGVPIPGVPFREDWGLIPNEAGRVLDLDTGTVLPGQYVVGWAKRGPSGLIGSNGPDSAATTALLLEDLVGQRPHEQEPGDITALLDARGVDHVGYDDWELLDAEEQRRGAEAGRPRCKFTSVEEMLEVLPGLRAARNT